MVKPKIAIIGASTGQIHICKKANELGYETHCFAYDKGAVCKEYVDFFYPISILEKDLIVEKCREIKVDGVVSNASDLTAEISSYVAEKLGLICTPYNVLISLHDKYLVRTLTEKIQDLSSPAYYFYEGIDKGIYPCVVKPCVGAGKIGVSFAKNSIDFHNAVKYASANDNDKILVEEYIEGNEISVESISYQGKHFIVQITDKDSSSAPHFVELGHHQPANLPQMICKKIKKVVPELLSEIGYINGASHLEFKYNKENLYLIEANLRGAGGHISNVLVQLSSGVDYLKCMLDVALGKFVFPEVTAERNFSGIYFLCKQTEYLLPFIHNSMDKEWVVDCQIFSTNLCNSCSNYDRNGYIIYKSDHKITPDES